ncbi:MAG: FG-GAP repeat domain-containing protein [Promethearchaeota archaeon]|jgi:hypothetical protein
MKNGMKNGIYLFSLVTFFLLSCNTIRITSIFYNTNTSSFKISYSQIETSADDNYVEVWNTGTLLGGGGSSIDSISTGDQDDDGKDEIIVGYLYLFKVLEFDEINNTFTVVFDSGFLDTTHAVSSGNDLDEDGKKEILHGTGSNFRLRIFEYDGNDNNYTQVFNEFMGIQGDVRDISIGDDLDKDGVKEIITTRGQAVNVFEHNGTDNGYSRTWWSPNIGWVFDVCGSDDLDKDGNKEIITASGKVRVFENSANNTYNEVWSSTLSDLTVVSVADDLDNDGKTEIITGGYVNDIVSIFEFNGSDNCYDNVWNSSNLGGDISAISVGNDLDMDGKLEIIVGSTNGTLTVFEYNGIDNGYNKVWDSGTLIGDAITSVSIGNDLDKNGKKEIMAGTVNTKIYIFENQAPTPSQEPPSSFELYSSAENPDLDGNFTIIWTYSERAENYSIYEHSSYISEINNSLTLLVHETISPSLQLSGYSNGTYFFKAIAFNNAGNSTSNCISITVSLSEYCKSTNGNGLNIPGYNILIFGLLISVSSAFLIIKKKKGN